MQLELFLNALIFLYLTDQQFQSTVNASGIDFYKLPEFQCVKIIKKYFSMLATSTHREVVFELSDDLSFLEMTGLDFTQVGVDDEEIYFRLQKNLREFRFLELSQKLAKSPALGQEILNAFDLDVINSSQPRSGSDFMPKQYMDFLEQQSRGVDLVRIPGFEMLSEMIGGFNPGRIIMLMGETGFGKTNFALNLTVGAAKKFKCLFINMEMPLEDITKRLAVLCSKKTFKNLYKGEISTKEATEHIISVGQNLKFTNGFMVSVQSIEALMKKQKNDGLDLVVIDYDQKIDLNYQKNIPEWKLLQLAIQRIEDVAKELSVCVIMLAQVNREGSISGSHRATFTAHTVLSFKRNDAPAPYPQSANALVAAEKNRHGKKDRACLLAYNQENLNITEVQVIDYKKPDGKAERSI